MSELFTEFPEEYALVVEIHKYCEQIVISVDPIISDVERICSEDITYPIIQAMNHTLKLIMESVAFMSPSFLLMMMTKHRYGVLGKIYIYSLKSEIRIIKII